MTDFDWRSAWQVLYCTADEMKALRAMGDKKMTRPEYYSDTPLKMLSERSFEHLEGYHLGVVYHYLYRAGRKEGESASSDVQKAISHLTMLLEEYLNRGL